MKILLLGATGRTGAHVLRQALQLGIAVHAVVRKPSAVRVASPLLTIFESPVLDEAALRAAMRGCDAVLSTLNISRKSEFPWSALRTPPHFLSDTLRRTLALADELGLTRFIVLTAWGVTETRRDLPGWFRWLVEHSNLGPAYQDHEQQERLLAASACRWTVIRPVILTNTQQVQQLRVSLHRQPAPRLFISRTSVAHFMLQAYLDNSYLRQAITISAAG